MAKVGSALDMIYSSSAKSSGKTAPSPAASHNPSAIRDQQQSSKNRTPVLSSLNTSQDARQHGHVRALSQSATAKAVIHFNIKSNSSIGI